MKSASLLVICLIALLPTLGCDELPREAGGEFVPAREGVLTVATDHLPQPGFWQGKEEPKGGFEWGLAQVLAEQFGLDEVEVIQVPFADLIAGDLGGADLAMSQITPTREREEVLDFSYPYLSANPAAIVRPETSIKDVMEARELKWAVQEGTTLVRMLNRLINPEEPPDLLAEQGDVVAAVRKGTADAGLLDLPVAFAYAGRSKGRLEVAAQIASDEALAVALPEGSENREAVDTALRSLINEGTIGELAGRWLGVELRGSAFTVEEVPVLRTN